MAWLYGGGSRVESRGAVEDDEEEVGRSMVPVGFSH